MTFSDRLRLFFWGKDSQARIVSQLQQVGRAQQTPANYEGFAKQGYSKNLIVYTAISKIAVACSGIEWCLYSKSKGSKLTEIEDSPLLTLLQKPNPLQAQASFFEAVVAFRCISGNSYIESNQPFANKPPLELWPVRPDKMKIIPGRQGLPAAYQFDYGGQKRTWDVDPVKLTSPIMHWKTFNPLNDWYGLSTLEAALLSVDQNNAGQKWNLGLLQNSASPSGVLQMKASDANPRGELTNEQYQRIKAEFSESYQGAKSAGKPILLEGGLNWQSMSLSPKEMDWLKGREATAIDICIAFGVPPEIVGLGQKTYANYQEARFAMYEETVLPTMDSLRDALNSWLVPAFGDNLYLDYDRDDIEALDVKRQAKFTSLTPVTFLTINEKREATGYDEIDGGDVLDRPSTPADPNADPNEDPKKPDDSTDDTEDTTPKDAVEDEEGDKGFGWKSINLLNQVEKNQSWKRQNSRRKQLTFAFNRELKEDFAHLTTRLIATANEMKQKEPKLIEYALYRDCTDWARTTLAKTIAKNIRHTLEDFGGMVLGEAKSMKHFNETKANLKFQHYVDEYVKQHTAKQISTINSTNEKTVRRIVADYTQEALAGGDTTPELAKWIGDEFEEISDSSAMRIARTETSMASNNGSLNAVKSLQAPNMFKEWVSASDGRVRDGSHGGADHTAVDGDEVPLDEKFTVPPDASMDGPGDPSGDADQVINCRCVLVYKSKAKQGGDDE